MSPRLRQFIDTAIPKHASFGVETAEIPSAMLEVAADPDTSPVSG